LSKEPFFFNKNVNVGGESYLAMLRTFFLPALIAAGDPGTVFFQQSRQKPRKNAICRVLAMRQQID
jgi:hypothetical protein